MTSLSAHSLVQSLRDVGVGSFTNEAERVEVKEALLAALRRVQSPFDTAMDHVWTEPASVAAIKTLIDANFWKDWVLSGGQPSTIEILSRMTSMDSTLLRMYSKNLSRT